MPNLIIIGNGFDLAHGLQTSYNDFIIDLIEKHLKNQIVNPKLFTIKLQVKNANEFLRQIKSGHNESRCTFHNKFFERLLQRYSKSNWCDIESEYFEYLMEIASEKIQMLNRFHIEFKQLIFHLQRYLTEVTQEPLEVKEDGSYFRFFKLIEKNNSLILNFNYTATVKYYLNENSTKIINIHGELNNEINPIVFGFAADNDESRFLIDKGKNDLLKYVKKHAYKAANNERRLREFLEYSGIKVFFMGHSAGISDKLILNQILNNKHVESITMFYHNNLNSYFNFQVNIDRIMNNDDNFVKLINYQDSIKMPQLEDDEKDTKKFITYCERIMKDQFPTLDVI